MLREDIHAHMAQLKLKGMLAAYDEIVPVGLKRRAMLILPGMRGRLFAGNQSAS